MNKKQCTAHHASDGRGHDPLKVVPAQVEGVERAETSKLGRYRSLKVVGVQKELPQALQVA